MYYDCALALLVTCAFVVSLNCRAIKNGKGLHSKKEVPIHRVADISGVGISFFFFLLYGYPIHKGIRTNISQNALI